MTKDEINYTWEIRGIKSKTINGVDNVVCSVTYFVMADYVDGDYDDVNLPTRVLKTQENVVEIPYNEGGQFIDYENLTQQEVLSWVFSIIDKDEIENNFYEELKNKYEQKVSESSSNDTTPLPW